ncbi:MAG: hypothetical protein PF487_11795 [Bacteroidales bacterium]|jgi:hypothetical protein|nr:hypothetical protein [Bacteroidales bacterium]
MDKNKQFPECSKDCEAIKMLGASECESVCGHKFDTNARQLTTPLVNGSALLQLSKISINEDYCKKWNIYLNDFVCLTKNGELLRNTLYRIGGLNSPKLNEDKYFLLIKHVEAYYSKDIIRMSENKDPKHLEGRWCILDKNGNEKVEFEQFEIPYLINDSCIYSIDGKYYNIENGEFYCDSSVTMQSTDYLFLENRYDEDKSKCGIMKINKQNGSWELFS